MKKFTKALLATAVLSSSAMATEVGFYAGGGFGVEAVPNYGDWKMGAGVVLRGGMTFDSVLEHFGAEIELTKSIVDPKVSRDNNPGRDKVNVTTFAAYAVYRIPVVAKFYVKPRFGVILPNLGGSKYANGDYVVNSRNVTFSSGIGVGYPVMDHLDVYMDYTVLGEAVTNYAAGVEWHF